VRQIFPAASDDLDASGLARLYGRPDAGQAGGAARPWVRANMISSADGASSVGGRSGPLGGPADRAVFRVLRSLADVILVGAGTARAERYRKVRAGDLWPALRTGRAPTPPIAVVTGTLDFTGCAPLLTEAPGQATTIVLTAKDAPAGRRADLAGKATVITAGRDQVDIGEAIAALRDLGYLNILAEGGPHLLGQIAAAGLLDELCLTISPVLAAGTAGRIVMSAGTSPAVPAALGLAHVLAEDGYLLCRYLRSEDERAT
jgi:riboflavin biosynthesis pyrimidine reductase